MKAIYVPASRTGAISILPISATVESALAAALAQKPSGYELVRVIDAERRPIWASPNIAW